MTAIRQRPETLAQGLLLGAVGGFLDAFTFVRFGVFANAQSGNIVLLGVDLGAARWTQAALRLAPVAAFTVGIVVVETLGRPRLRRTLRRPLRWALGAEIAGLVVVAVLPDSAPELAVTLTVSFVAAVQFGTFRTLVDMPYTTLLASGNLRAVVSGIHRWLIDRDPADRARAGRLAVVVVAFLAGALVGALLTRHVGNAAVGVPAGLLLITLVELVAETRRLERGARAVADPAPTGPS